MDASVSFTVISVTAFDVCVCVFCRKCGVKIDKLSMTLLRNLFANLWACPHHSHHSQVLIHQLYNFF